MANKPGTEGIPDLGVEGIPTDELAPGAIASGEFNGEPVVVVRDGDQFFAIGGSCTHYGADLSGGIYDGMYVRCPWHHACFDVRTGEAARAPALDPQPRYDTAVRDGRVYVRAGARRPEKVPPRESGPDSVVVCGGGAAASAAVEMLVREGYSGSITMISDDPDVPYDRPALSKAFLAGQLPADDVPLRDERYYRGIGVDLLNDVAAAAIDPGERIVTLSDGRRLPYDALLLATGAEPVHLDIPGADYDHVHYLRTFEDSRRIAAAAEYAGAIAVIGASFIGMEVASSLRQRGRPVSVIAPETLPFERMLGTELGTFLLEMHFDRGVSFHLGQSVDSIKPGRVFLDSGESVEADLVVVGVGVRPRVELAESAGLRIEDGGVVVDEFLGTSQVGIWAAGDIARWPDPYLERPLRAEHWIVAQRHGQVAARNMLGFQQPFTFPPLFWTRQYDVSLGYVGFAPDWDEVEVLGDVADPSFIAGYRKHGRIDAVAAVNRDRDWLRAEMAMERNDQEALESLFRG